MRILAVDDDPIFLELLRGMLRNVGQEDVTVVSSGQQALQVLDLSAKPFDCLLLDIQMPQMSGVELCSAIRAMNAYRSTPIVMITAMSGRTFVDDAFIAGATDYIVKPLDRLELKARIGMVERLHQERVHMAALAAVTGMAGASGFSALDFSAPLLIPGIDRGTEYLAMENYLLTIGITRMFSLAAFGIHVRNASAIFNRATPVAFVNMLGDVATAIFGELKTEQVLLAYAGSGNFVGIARRTLSTDADDLEIMINNTLTEYESIYASDRLPVPVVSIGAPTRSSVFGLNKPTRILEQAIAVAQSKSGKKAAVGRLVA
jgi:CheY-like chemotaxis protein